jgi:hypothetical protein
LVLSLYKCLSALSVCSTGHDIVEHTESADRHLYSEKNNIIDNKHLAIRQFASTTGKHRITALSMIVKHPDFDQK